MTIEKLVSKMVVAIKLELLDGINELIGVGGVGRVAVFLQLPGSRLVIFGGGDAFKAVVVIDRAV